MWLKEAAKCTSPGLFSFHPIPLEMQACWPGRATSLQASSINHRRLIKRALVPFVCLGSPMFFIHENSAFFFFLLFALLLSSIHMSTRVSCSFFYFESSFFAISATWNLEAKVTVPIYPVKSGLFRWQQIPKISTQFILIFTLYTKHVVAAMAYSTFGLWWIKL